MQNQFLCSAIILVILNCALPINCDISANETSLANAPNITGFEIDATSLNDTDPEISELSSLIRDVLPASVQPRVFSVLSSLFRVFRFFFHHIHEAYLWYRPEIRFGRCMISFARKQYPELRQRLTLDNIQKFTWRMYDDISTYAWDLVSESQAEEYLNRNRIASKVMHFAYNTLESRHADNADIVPAVQQRPPQQWMMVQRPTVTRRMDGRPMHRVAYMALPPRRQRRTIVERPQTNDTVMRIAPRVDYIDDINDEFSDLDEKSWAELLDFESVIYDSLGIDKKTAKEWTPINCGREYAVHFIKRFIIAFLSGRILG